MIAVEAEETIVNLANSSDKEISNLEHFKEEVSINFVKILFWTSPCKEYIYNQFSCNRLAPHVQIRSFQ